jgi:hypothetical protein
VSFLGVAFDLVQLGHVVDLNIRISAAINTGYEYKAIEIPLSGIFSYLILCWLGLPIYMHAALFNSNLSP